MKRIVQTFFDLVQIDSPTGHEEKIADYCVKFLQENQLVDSVVKDSSNNVFAKVNGEGEAIFLNAHLDTVEPGRGIKPQIQGEYLVSDGTTILGADDKVGVAVILETLNQLKENNIPHRPLEILFTTSEEVGSYGAFEFDYSQLDSKLGFCFDTSNPVGTIISAQPFYERFDLKIIGRSAHPSKYAEAINVLLVLRDFLAQVQLGLINEDLLINIGRINLGHVRNTIPGEVEINGEIRSFTEEELLKAKANLIKIGEEITQKYQAQFESEFTRENDGYKHDSKEAKQAIEFIKQKMASCDITPNLIPTWGLSDVNTFNTKDLLCFNLGEGSERAHTKEERVKISEMEKLVQLILNLCGRD